MKKQTNYILSYGTLRRGNPSDPNNRDKTYNFQRFNGQKYIETLKVDGFELYNLGFYPCIAAGEGQVVVELHEVDPIALQSIDSMEAGAGYNKQEITIFSAELNQEVSATIYSYNKRDLPAHILNKKIVSGDWCKG